MSASSSVEVLVCGAGVIGLAVARAFARAGKEVLIVEAASSFGTQTSSRNSEVIHAGLYYRPGSLKARLCVSGRHLLYDFCQQYGVPHKRVSKLIVGTEAGHGAVLERIRGVAAQNGVTDLQLVSAREAREMEPELHCTQALLSPSTGIIDSHQLMLALLGDAEEHGAILACNAPLTCSMQVDDDADGRGLVVEAGGMRLRPSLLINSAGLAAVPLAQALHQQQEEVPWIPPRPYYCKGNYFKLQGRSSPFSRLIYPVPEAAGLGIHATFDLGGQTTTTTTRFGPDTQWVDDPHDLHVEPHRAHDFITSIRRYWPGVEDDGVELVPDYAGMRPKLQSPSDKEPSDFLVVGPKQHGVAGLVHLLGMESPGLTSCLAIAQHVLLNTTLPDGTTITTSTNRKTTGSS